MQHALRSLANALESGLPLNDPALAAMLPPRVRTAVSAGREIAPAFKGTLDDAAIATLAAGERGGFLPKALRLVADDLDEARSRKRRALLALAYPAFLVVMATVILPLPVAVTGGFDAYARAVLPGLGAVVVGAVILFVVVPRLPATLLARIPIFGAIVLDNARATVLDVLARQLAAGVPTSIALPSSMRAGLSSWRAGNVDDGLAAALATVIQDPRIGVAEKTGHLDTELPRIARELRARARRKFIALTIFFALLCFLAVAIAIGRALVTTTQGYFDAIDRATM